jgi:hypothetical protein
MSGRKKGEAILPEQMQFSGEEFLKALPEPRTPLEDLFVNSWGRWLTKWTHYLRFYEQVLSAHRGKPVRMLEIGVQHGGSLDMWRSYFGPQAKLFGIDIDPQCLDRVTAPNQVRIGSQDDAAFLTSVIDEMGGVDVVLDDGSHLGAHQRASFHTLWPRLSYGGVYIIEDLHSSYWREWEGGYRKPGTGIELVKELIDDMHGWFHKEHEEHAPREELEQIMIRDSIAAIHKTQRSRPGFVIVGDPARLRPR